MSFSEIVTYSQAVATVLAIILNSFLIYIVWNYSRKSIGRYKYVLAGFAAFEMTFAIVVFFGMPVNYIGFNSWIVFTHGGFIGNTKFAILGPTLYCIFYEIWISLVVVHFVYRYVTLCRTSWKDKLVARVDIQAIIITFYVLHLLYICFCAFFFCTANEMPGELNEDVRKVFNIDPNEPIGYILFRLHKPSGELSPGSIASFLNHYIYIYISIGLILYCGFNIQRQIGYLQSHSFKLRNVTLQKQIFMTLLIQTIIPIFLVHIPSGLYLTLPLLSMNISLGSATIIFSFLGTIPKLIDPIIVLYCIKDYRDRVKNIFGRKKLVVPAATISRTSAILNTSQPQQSSEL